MVEVDGRIIRGNDSHLKHDIFTLYFRFCQSNSPDITIGNEKGLTILFISDMEETGGGAKCIAECIEEKLEATTLKSSGKNVNVKFNVLQYYYGIFEDYICPEERSKTIITIENGDYLTYNTNPGESAE